MSDQFVNQLHYGDNLERLRNHIPNEVADLVYLDPPFNSARNYNLLFKQHKGQDSPAQIMAFEDTWQWSPREYQRFQRDDRNQPLWKLVAALYEILGDSEMMAYIVMMAPRLLELHRKLKPTGSLFLHCDPAASHYLKIILDVIFQPAQFQNEVIWKRSSAHNDTKQGMRRCGRIHDVLLFYTKTAKSKWNPLFTDYSEEYIASLYRFVAPDGRRYREGDLTAAKPGGDTSYPWYVKRSSTLERWVPDFDEGYANPVDGWEYMTVHPYKGRYWAYKKETLIDLWNQGRIIHRSTGFPQLMRFLDKQQGVSLQDIWDDIVPLSGSSKEKRGYPTQKPLALLERIVMATTDPDDVILDPFAGCGTAIVAAERTDRHWIGIDVTYLAINEIVDRLNEEKREGHALTYVLEGTPTDEAAASALFASTAAQNHKPFEQWAVTLVGGRYNEKRGADRGVDGRIALWGLDGKYQEGLIQVKGGNGLTLSTVRDFANVIESNSAVFGILVSQREPTKEMLLVAEKMGLAQWPGIREIPRYQIFTTQQILEQGKHPIIPEGYRIQSQVGVGRAQTAHQHDLFAGDE